MAVFNPQIQEPVAERQTGNSGGPIVRRGLGTLFEGVAEVGVNIANTLDFRNQYNLREDIRTGVEIVRDQYGVNAGSDTAQGSLFQYDQSPEGLNEAYGQIDTLEQAYQNGTLRESYYYAQLNSIVRSVKSRYPGYEEQIDDAIRSIAGVDPANAYISQTRQEAAADAASGASAQNKLLEDINRDRGVITALDPEFFGRPLDEQLAAYDYGSPLRLAVSQSNGLAANMDYRNNMVASGRMDEMTAARDGLQDINNTFWATISNQAGDTPGDGGFPSPEEVMQHLVNAGVDVDPSDLTAGVTYFRSLSAGLEDQMRESLRSYSNLDNEEIERQIDSYIAPFDLYIDSIMNGDTGMAALAEMTINLSDNQMRLALDEAFGGVVTGLQVLKDVLPEPMLEYMTTNSLEGITQFGAAIGQFLLDRANLAQHPEQVAALGEALGVPITPNADGTLEIGINDVAQVLANGGLQQEQVGAAMQTIIDTNLNIIRGTIDGTTPYNSDAIGTAVQALFGIDGGFDLNMIPPNEQHAVYATLTSPSLSYTIKAQSPEAWQAYYDWSVNEFRVINDQTIDDLAAYPDYVWDKGSLVFNQRSNQFEFRLNPNIGVGSNGRSNPATTSIIDSAQLADINSTLDLLNGPMSNMGAIFGAEGLNMDQTTLQALLPGFSIPVTFVNESALGPISTSAQPPAPTPLANEGIANTRPANPPVEGTGGRGVAPAPAAPAPVNTNPNGAFQGLGAAIDQASPDRRERLTGPNTNPELVAQEQEQYRTMGWDQINQLDYANLTPEQRTMAASRIQELTAAGDFNPLTTVTEGNVTTMTKEANNFVNKFAPAGVDKEAPEQVAISRILLEPTNNTTPTGQSVDQVVANTHDPLSFAASFIGANEETSRATLAAFFRRAVGSDFDPVELPWCARFVNAVLRSTGYDTTGANDWARSFMNAGEPTTSPRQGDVVVFERGGNPQNGHVAFFVGYDANGNVRVLGGNQGDEVSISSYSAEDVLGYRRFTQ